MPRFELVAIVSTEIAAGSIQGGFNPVGPAGRHPRWANDDSAFYEHVRKTRCNAEGRFEFEAPPDGEWFVEAMVTWEVPRVRSVGDPQGGAVV